jgi:hypothetical protein
MLVAFSRAQQIMTGLSGVASEEEKLSVNTKPVSSLVNRNGDISS